MRLNIKNRWQNTRNREKQQADNRSHQGEEPAKTVSVSPRALFLASADFLSQNDRRRTSHADKKDPGQLTHRIHNAECGKRICACMRKNRILRGNTEAPKSF